MQTLEPPPNLLTQTLWVYLQVMLMKVWRIWLKGLASLTLQLTQERGVKILGTQIKFAILWAYLPWCNKTCPVSSLYSKYKATSQHGPQELAALRSVSMWIMQTRFLKSAYIYTFIEDRKVVPWIQRWNWLPEIPSKFDCNRTVCCRMLAMWQLFP